LDDGSSSGDIKSPALLYIKAGLFVVMGLVAGVVLFLQNPRAQTVLLIAVMVWAFCRAYYFVFYVIQHYVDPDYKFSGLWSVLSYWMRRKK
jgi:hypothetical protein